MSNHPGEQRNRAHRPQPVFSIWYRELIVFVGGWKWSILSLSLEHRLFLAITVKKDDCSCQWLCCRALRIQPCFWKLGCAINMGNCAGVSDGFAMQVAGKSGLLGSHTWQNMSKLISDKHFYYAWSHIWNAMQTCPSRKVYLQRRLLCWRLIKQKTLTNQYEVFQIHRK